MYASWQGWGEEGEKSTRPRKNPGWLELSHPLRADLARISYFPPARFERIMSIPKDPLNLTEMQMVCHFGTHVDAPRHFVPDGPAVHEIPLDRLYGPGVVWRIPCESYDVIEPATLERQQPRLRPGDILLLDTGCADHFGTKLYEEHASVSPAAAEWLVNRRIKLLGVDCATPDLAVHRRPVGFDWPVHRILLSRGVLIAEHLTNLHCLAGQRVEAMFLALSIEGADGAPARVIARKLSGR
jgi:kynurenine formamidase